jgi:L-ascorbate metabolism protein UlaG (beta-lactamase superfamily)
MKITRFAQSCILIETKAKRILIDPGFLQFDDSLLENEWNDIDVLLVTHKHADHCHVPAILEIIKNPKTKFYTSTEVANQYPELSPEIVKQGDIIILDEIKVEVVKAVHGYMPFLKNGKKVNENIGFIIDDGENRAYQTSDTICFNNDYRCDVLFVPVCNHGLVMGPFEAALFAKETKAKLVIPIHYDNPKFPVDINQVKKVFEAQEINYQILDIKESIEL